MEPSQQRCEREVRVACRGPLHYIDAAGQPGEAQWLEISRVGARLQLGRYLRPGGTLTIVLAVSEEVEHTLPARVIWCRPAPGSEAFVAGLRVQRPRPEAALAWASQWFAAQQAGRAADSGLRPVLHALPTLKQSPEADVARLTRVVCVPA